MRIDNISTVPGDIGLVPSCSLSTSASYLDGSGWVQTNGITITATTTPPTKGSPIGTDYIRYRLVAPKEYEVDMAYQHGNAGVAGDGDYLFNLPGGLTFNTTYHPLMQALGSLDNAAEGISFIRGSLGQACAAGSIGSVSAISYDSSRFKLVVINSLRNSAPTNNPVRSDRLGLGNASVAYNVKFTFTAA